MKSVVLGVIFLLILGTGSVVWAEQGSPWLLYKGPISRMDFARAIEMDNRRVIRIPAEKFVEVWGLSGLPLLPGNPVQWGMFLREDSEVTEIPCREWFLRGFYVARLLPGGRMDLDWGRETCLPGEIFLAWRGVPFVSLGCGNPVRLRMPRPPAGPPTTTVVVPPPAPPQPPVAECVELVPFYRGRVVFPTIEDRAAWFHCNPQADCVVDCLDWVSGRNARPFPRPGSSAARSQQEAARVRELTGQGSRGGHAALEGATHMPVTRHGPAVFCKKGTHEYWVLDPDNKVRKGLD